MTSNKKTAFYVGRFLSEDNEEYEYRVAQIENIDRTIEEYGTDKSWTQAQQVLAFLRCEIVLLESCEEYELIFYNTVFPTMTPRQANDIILEEEINNGSYY